MNFKSLLSTKAFIFAALLLTLVSLPVLAFLVTSEPSPYDSELAFIEHSDNNQVLGSVIPASCESDPPNQGIAPNWDAPSPCQCAISAGACTGPSCIKTVNFATDFSPVLYGPWQIFRDGAYITNSGSPSASVNFTMTPAGSTFQIRRPDGVTICSAFVAGPPAPTLNFTALQNPINPGTSSTLSWSSTGATSCTASGGWSGAKSIGGTETVTPAANTTYVLQCNGAGGSITRTATVVVNPPLVTFTATPTLIGPGNSSQLSWSTTGATSCTASGGWSGAKSVGDTETVSPTLTSIYSLTCSGPSGTTARSATVTLPTGYISSASCNISDEANSCNVAVVWQANNFLNTPSVRQAGTQFANTVAHPIGGFTRAVNPDTRLFQLVDTGSNFMAQHNAVVDCVPTSLWVVGVRCVTLPVIDMSASSELIRSGSTAQLTIEIDSAFALTCTLSDGGSPYVFAHSGTPSLVVYTPLTNPPLTTRALTSAQIVTINCVSNDYPTVQTTDEVRINVVPTIQEI